MSLTRYYHMRQQNGVVLDITLYAKLTDKEVIDSAGDIREAFFDEEWNDRDEHWLISEEGLEILKRKIENALKEK